jgi:hypothetical protein
VGVVVALVAAGAAAAGSVAVADAEACLLVAAVVLWAEFRARFLKQNFEAIFYNKSQKLQIELCF